MLQIFKDRAKIISSVRRFFVDQGFLEVETPLLVKYPGLEPYLNPFETEVINERGDKFLAHLITSPEYSMKKILADGASKIFNITKCFRNHEPFGGSHNPEFTMIEWYRTPADYLDIMVDVENMVYEVAFQHPPSPRGVGGIPNSIIYQNRSINLTPPWPRISAAELFGKLGINLDRAITDLTYFKIEAGRLEVGTADSDTFDDIYFRIFLRDIEPKLGLDQPVIVYDYPRSMAALSKIKASEPLYAERFEVYCAGLELGNAFSELNDSELQRQRLVGEQDFRRTLNKPVFGLDEDFLEAVGRMPKAGGIAFGLDRLVMLLTDSKSIEDVLPFSARKLFK